MAAAPADFRPTSFQDAKIKKSADGSTPALELGRTPTSWPRSPRPGSVPRRHRRLRRRDRDCTGSVLELGRAKLARKRCDLLVVNDVSQGAVFGSDDNEAVILGADGASVEVPRGPKSQVAHAIWDEVVHRLA